MFDIKDLDIILFFFWHWFSGKSKIDQPRHFVVGYSLYGFHYRLCGNKNNPTKNDTCRCSFCGKSAGSIDHLEKCTCNALEGRSPYHRYRQVLDTSLHMSNPFLPLINSLNFHWKLHFETIKVRLVYVRWTLEILCVCFNQSFFLCHTNFRFKF